MGVWSVLRTVGRGIQFAASLGKSGDLHAGEIKRNELREQLAHAGTRLTGAHARCLQELSLLGDEKQRATRILRRASRFLLALERSASSRRHHVLDAVQASRPDIVLPPIASAMQSDATLSALDKAVSSVSGIATGAATGLGAWAIVSAVGVASTGAAISSLSGAAATSATLAWFGGGAIAAGGAGMAAGMLVFGGVVAVPAVATSLYAGYVRRQLGQVEGEIGELEQANTRCSEATAYYDVVSIRASSIREQIAEGALACWQTLRFGTCTLYPIPLMSGVWIWVLRLLRRWRLSAEVMAAVHELDLATERLARALPVSVFNGDGTLP